jgi:hypothetical protein
MRTGSALPGRVPGHDGLHSVEFRRVLKLAHARRHNLAACRRASTRATPSDTAKGAARATRMPRYRSARHADPCDRVVNKHQLGCWSPLHETEGPAGAGPAAYFLPWPGGEPPCPGALPECPGGLVPCPGALPLWPGALPEFPRGLPAWPGAPPECPGGLAAWPGAVPFWLGAVLLWPGALPRSLGDLGARLGTFPVWPGDVAE